MAHLQPFQSTWHHQPHVRSTTDTNDSSTSWKTAGVHKQINKFVLRWLSLNSCILGRQLSVAHWLTQNVGQERSDNYGWWSAATRLSSNPAGGMDVYFECCVSSGTGHCGGPITSPEESYRTWCVIARDLKTSRMRRPWPALGCCAQGKKI